MKTVVELMSVENPVFTTFVAWSCMLIIKMMILSVVTAFFRLKSKVRTINFPNFIFDC